MGLFGKPDLAVSAIKTVQGVIGYPLCHLLTSSAAGASAGAGAGAYNLFIFTQP